MKQRQIINDSEDVINEVADQVYMLIPDMPEDQQLMDFISLQLRTQYNLLKSVLEEDGAAAKARAKSLPRLLNEGIL